MEKRVLDFVDELNTLSEAEANEILESLDDATLDLIEQVLSENLPYNYDEKGKRIPVYGKTGTKNVSVMHKNRLKGGQPPEDIGDFDAGTFTDRASAEKTISQTPAGARELAAGNFKITPVAFSQSRSRPRGQKKR